MQSKYEKSWVLIILGLFLAFAAFLVFPNLGKRALMDFDEAIYARVLKESIAQGDLINLTLSGRPWIDKPPLYFWLAYASSSLTGGLNEFSARLPSALMTICAVFLIFLITKKLTSDNHAALYSTAVILTMGFFVFSGKQMRLDLPMIFAGLLFFYTFIKGAEKDIFYLLSGACLALAVMFKSFTGLIFILPALLYSIIYNNWGFLRSFKFYLGITLFFLLIAPWHIISFADNPGIFLKEYLFNVQNRFSSPDVQGGRTSPLFFARELSTLTQPYFVIFPFLSVFLIINFQKIRNYKFIFFSFSTALLIIIFFLFLKNSLLYYFLPAFPFIAMFSGYLFSRFAGKNILFKILIWAVILIGAFRTVMINYSDEDRGFFFNKLIKPSRYQIAEEEKIIALTISKYPQLTSYLYNWSFYPTLMYYSNNASFARITRAQLKTIKDQSFLILIPSPLMNEKLEMVLSEYFSQTEILFRGETGILIFVTQI